jgi:hypothetical protein
VSELEEKNEPSEWSYQQAARDRLARKESCEGSERIAYRVDSQERHGGLK